ncbi:hypoxia up-regulated protein 1 [Tetranychus urticae]|uniref:Hypoxia up-regulated protein 1 n=1 Tax=Tetranychus urticae TaxID=32264 RepID=T1JUD8_TETUR|nr:hypoxia up-regulated protein 1 [Tetranychus urticae]
MRLFNLFWFFLVSLSLFGQGHGLAVMSIDLGTESLKIAIVSPGKPMEIILNTDSQRKTPLAVAFRDGDRLFGEAALSTAVRFPEKVFTHFLDLIGKNYDSPAVKLFKTRFPYHNMTKDPEKSTVILHHPDGMTFTPEEILAMVLHKAKSDAEIAAGDKQSIKDAVITVPPYFSQAERRSLTRSVQMAGLKVLQLMNTNTAVALNYGAFRRKDFNESNPNFVLFYEMGASSTVATVVAYQTVKTKERGFVESNPQLTIKGVGFDRNLGGLEMQIRLRDYLAKLFVEQTKNKYPVQSNKRAMAKLFKEAGRLKKVLSANTEHVAQVENVLNDIDLKAPVKRTDFEDLCSDLLGDRLTKPVMVALESAGLTMQEVDQVILFGGNTRVPRVQQALLDYFKINELGKSVNADEAAALGGAYQAAHLSKGFKVKTFIVKDANLYPIQVDFSREIVGEDGSKKTRLMQRVLFTRNNLYPTKKVLTFSRHSDDFEFFINYGDLQSFFSEEDIANIGSLNITKIQVKGVTEAMAKHKDENKEYKGIRAHFRMDESGILNMENVETVFEAKIEEPIEAEKGNVVGDAFAKFGNTISKLFGGGGSEEAVPTTGEEKPEEPSKESVDQSTNESTNGVNGTDSSSKASPNVTEKQDQAAAQNVSAESSTPVKTEVKIKTIKEPVIAEKTDLDLPPLDDSEINWSIKKLQDLIAKDEEKHKRDGMKNSLESFITETKMRLYENEYESASTQEEREKILKALETTSEWLETEADSADSKTIEEKLFSLMKTARDVFERVKEHKERPEALKALNEILNISRMFYEGALNTSAEDQIFTEVEITTLGKLVKETEVWLGEAVSEQERIPRFETPKLLVRNIQEKIVTLDREVKYLINKARTTPPKPKTTDDTAKPTENEADSSSEGEPNDETINMDQAAEDNIVNEVETDSKIKSDKPSQKAESSAEQSTTEKPLELSSNDADQQPQHSQKPKPTATVDEPHTEL